MRSSAIPPAPPAKTRMEKTLSLVELMKSLGPREVRAGSDATLYFPIDERQGGAGKYQALAREDAPLLPGVPETEAKVSSNQAPKVTSLRRLADSVARATRTKKLILVLLPALMALFAMAPPNAPNAPLRPLAAAPTAPPSTTERAANDVPSTAIPAPVVIPATTVEGGPSTERSAADRVAGGDFDGALELYRRLAETHPHRPAFVEAARILERREAALKNTPR